MHSSDKIFKEFCIIGESISGVTKGVLHLLELHAEITDTRHILHKEDNEGNKLLLGSKPGVAAGRRLCLCEGSREPALVLEVAVAADEVEPVEWQSPGDAAGRRMGLGRQRGLGGGSPRAHTNTKL